jgi:hypothetical protein
VQVLVSLVRLRFERPFKFINVTALKWKRKLHFEEELKGDELLSNSKIRENAEGRWLDDKSFHCRYRSLHKGNHVE